MTGGMMRIEFTPPADARPHLSVFDVSGRLIKRLVEEDMVSAGAVSWDGRDTEGRPVGNGVYVLKLSAPEWTLTKRVVLLR